MKKLILFLSLFFSFNTFSYMRESLCFNVNEGIESTLKRIDLKKKYLIITGKLIGKKGKVLLLPENSWGSIANDSNLIEIILPNKNKFFQYQIKNGLVVSRCEPSYDVKIGDRIVLFKTGGEYNKIDLSDYYNKFYVLDKKNEKYSQPRDVEIYEAGLIQQISNKFGSPKVYPKA